VPSFFIYILVPSSSSIQKLAEQVLSKNTDFMSADDMRCRKNFLVDLYGMSQVNFANLHSNIWILMLWIW